MMHYILLTWPPFIFHSSASASATIAPTKLRCEPNPAIRAPDNWWGPPPLPPPPLGLPAVFAASRRAEIKPSTDRKRQKMNMTILPRWAAHSAEPSSATAQSVGWSSDVATGMWTPRKVDTTINCHDTMTEVAVDSVPMIWWQNALLTLWGWKLCCWGLAGSLMWKTSVLEVLLGGL